MTIRGGAVALQGAWRNDPERDADQRASGISRRLPWDRAHDVLRLTDPADSEAD
jgi:hypothetical protein